MRSIMKYQHWLFPVLVVIAASIASQACCKCEDGQPPQPQPEPPIVVEPPEDPHLPDVPDLNDPDPNTPVVAQPTDYLTLERATWELDMFNGNGLSKTLQHHWHTAHLDIDKVLLGCPGAWGTVFDLDVQQATEFSSNSLEHHNRGRLLEARLLDVNRRCQEQPAFCDRSNVRKTVIAEVKQALKDDIAAGSVLRAQAQASACPGSNFDSIAGWCQQCGQ